ncbi:endo-1,4-beta-xylanase (glycosyl hydrolase family 10) [Micromonospora citrea]|uniref:Beta-xylanase n=1 Tax=Micromonospora citrea TaxID=47855 RepID=A0A1C6W1M1_9ACTN|nr:endo-1,4-beta-xylanase [Micromonospora citrea]SCL72479.1 endo-1,4-beta-xylanase (glycosyl hydrolase family 10) [Micromonospora citrea]
MPTHPHRAGRIRPALLAAVLAAGAVLAVGHGISRPDAAEAATTLKSLADAKGRDIGVAIDPGRLAEAPYKQIADNEFNLVVAENAMKWDATEPARGQFNFGQGDAVADYAASGGKRLYGHTLVWHSQLPGWAAELPGPELLAAMRAHIAGVAGHYRGKVVAWDVVNEAFADGGSGGRRDSVFQQRIGDGWIEEAFRAARAADPGAKLCINDYSTDGVNAKSTAIFNLVRDFKARGVPIDCVGFQAHLIVGQVPGDLQANLQRFADLGVDVRITELDIRMPTPASAANLATQAADYRRVVAACLAVARCAGVTTWGITDRYSWIPSVFPGQGAALIWDDNYAPKPAYQAVAEALGGGATPTPTTPAPSTPAPGTGCTVAYVPNSWNNGFTAEVRVRNDGTTPVVGWTVAFGLPAGQRVTNAWNATVTQNGAQVEARNASWNATISAGGTVGFGFQGTHGGTNPSPSAFTLNGAPCRTA